MGDKTDKGVIYANDAHGVRFGIVTTEQGRKAYVSVNDNPDYTDFCACVQTLKGYGEPTEETGKDGWVSYWWIVDDDYLKGVIS
ncbi:hypothetical protein [Streptomyces smyrnaeus]|uniref:hypothetical protein n=1 Tax=Streptomyces smyrnaeus TaxID=1387713 RepID=UPI0036BCAFAC